MAFDLETSQGCQNTPSDKDYTFLRHGLEKVTDDMALDLHSPSTNFKSASEFARSKADLQNGLRP